MLRGKIIKDMETIGSRFTAEIEGEKLFDAEVPSSLTVQQFFFKKDGEQVYFMRFNPKEGMKNMAREKKDQKNAMYDILNFRNKIIGSLCERTDNAFFAPLNYAEIRYGHAIYEGYVISTKDGLKVTLFEQETGEQVALGERNGVDYELYGKSEIALKVLSIFIVVGEVKTKHGYAWVSFSPIGQTRNKKLLEKYDPNFKKI
jgi:hypothetical protein